MRIFCFYDKTGEIICTVHNRLPMQPHDMPGAAGMLELAEDITVDDHYVVDGMLTGKPEIPVLHDADELVVPEGVTMHVDDTVTTTSKRSKLVFNLDPEETVNVILTKKHHRPIEVTLFHPSAKPAPTKKRKYSIEEH